MVIPECFARRWTKLGGEHPQFQTAFTFYKRYIPSIRWGSRYGSSPLNKADLFQKILFEHYLPRKKSFDLRAVWIAAISCWKIKFSSNKRVLLMKSDDRFKMPMYPIASWRPCPTFHSSPTWECAPYHDSASFAPSRWESLRRDILFMPMALNTIKVNIFLRIIKISSTSQHHVYDDFWKIPISQ